MIHSSPSDTTSALLAIDIGNTRTHLGIISPADRTCHAATVLPTGSILDAFGSAYTSLQQKSGMAVPKTAVITSVVQEATELTARQLGTKGIASFTLNDRSSLPITIDYLPAESLGTDRIANALFGYTLYPESPVILVCMGTAITIDLIEQKTFRGGAILPGLQLQLDALAGNTDALPQLAFRNVSTIPALPAHTTADAILSGIAEGTAGAVDRIVASYKKGLPGQRIPVICTGGDWNRFASLTQFESETHPHATLIGTALLRPYCSVYNV